LPADEAELAVKCKKYLAIFDEIIDNKLNMSVPTLINKALENLKWFAVIQKSPAKNKIIPNVEKFIDFARSYINLGFKNIYNFVEELDYIDSKLIDEPEAAANINIDAVNIMTIHASKGLEFPVVILYKTNSKPRAIFDSILHKDLGYCFPFNFKNDANITKGAVSSFFELAKEFQKNKEDAEQRRILYVALTRAKNELYISGTITKTKDGLSIPKNSFLDIISDALDFKTQLMDKKTSFELSSNLKILLDGETKPVNLKLPVQLVNKANSDAKNEIKTDEKEVRFLLNTIQGSINGEYISASRLMAFLNAIKAGKPEQYVEKYILGIPEVKIKENIDYVSEGDEYGQEITGASLGTAVHYVMENLKHWFISQSINEEELKKYVSNALNNYYYHNEKNIETVSNLCRNAALTPLLFDNSEIITGGMNEKTFYLPLLEDYIQGTLDLIVKNEAGQYEVWDWKTNYIPESIQETAMHYQAQMALYTYFVFKSFPRQDKYYARLLFIRKAALNAETNDWTYLFEWTFDEMLEYEKQLFAVISKAKNYPFLEQL